MVVLFMALKLKELTSNKKFFLGILFLLVILVAYIILQLKSSSIPTTPPLSVSPPSPPTPNPQLVISQQKLNFTWETSLPADTPIQLPFYTITQPLLNSTTIPNISNYFNFFPQHQINTETTDSLWVNNNLSLFISPSQQLLTYNNANPEPNLPSPSKQELTTQSDKIISQIFPNSNFKINPLNTTETSDLSSILNYSQTINDYFIVTPTTSNSILTLILNNQLQIQYLEILGGYQQTTTSENFSIINTQSQLETIAPSTAIRLHTSNYINQESSIDQSSIINFTVKEISLIYYQPESSDILHPSFLLQGNLKTSTTNLENARFIVPAQTN